MKKVFVITVAMLFIIGSAAAFADENGCGMAKESGAAACCAKGDVLQASSQTPEKAEKQDPHAGCAAKHGSQATTGSAAETPPAANAEAQPASAAAIVQGKSVEETAVPHTAASCPDVGSKEALNSFHANMHPMHVALNDGKYDEIRTLFSKLEATTAGVASFMCPMGDKCPPECLKEFETRKASLIKSVDELGAACKSDDNKKVEDSFNTMHEAYIKFASQCGGHEKEATKATRE